MNAKDIAELAKATMNGSMPFPEIVGKLIANGVEYYHVDYALSSFSFYTGSGTVVTAPLVFEGLPSISEHFDTAALKAAILDSQQHGQNLGHFVSAPSRRGCKATLRSFGVSA